MTGATTDETLSVDLTGTLGGGREGGAVTRTTGGVGASKDLGGTCGGASDGLGGVVDGFEAITG